MNGFYENNFVKHFTKKKNPWIVAEKSAIEI